jgi:hypothetical protein
MIIGVGKRNGLGKMLVAGSRRRELMDSPGVDHRDDELQQRVSAGVPTLSGIPNASLN